MPRSAAARPAPLPWDAAFAALADPTRRLILDVLLTEGERSVGEIVDSIELSQPAVSKHLRALREAGLVDVRADQQRRRYRVRFDGLAEIEDWLEPYRRFWQLHLDRLEAHLATASDAAADPAGPGPTPPTGPAPATAPAMAAPVPPQADHGPPAEPRPPDGGAHHDARHPHP